MEGYGVVVLFVILGLYILIVFIWRFVEFGMVVELRRFFIGGFLELEDFFYVWILGFFKGECLSCFGFCMEIIGIVIFCLYCL